MLSYIQHKILALALMGNAIRYSDLKPEDVDQDLFNYHLRFLLDKKYLIKENDLYSLTDFGKKYVIQMDVKGAYKSMFRVSVICIVVKEFKGQKEILMQKRLRHPFYGDINLGISGKVEPVEFIVDATKRKLKEETGLEANFKQLGIVRHIRKDSHNNLIEDTFYNVCINTSLSGDLLKSTDYGLNFWYEFDKLKIIELIQNNVTFGKIDEFVINQIINPVEAMFFKEDMQILPSV